MHLYSGTRKTYWHFFVLNLRKPLYRINLHKTVFGDLLAFCRDYIVAITVAQPLDKGGQRNSISDFLPDLPDFMLRVLMGILHAHPLH